MSCHLVDNEDMSYGSQTEQESSSDIDQAEENEDVDNIIVGVVSEAQHFDNMSSCPTNMRVPSRSVPQNPAGNFNDLPLRERIRLLRSGTPSLNAANAIRRTSRPLIQRNSEPGCPQRGFCTRTPIGNPMPRLVSSPGLVPIPQQLSRGVFNRNGLGAQSALMNRQQSQLIRQQQRSLMTSLGQPQAARVPVKMTVRKEIDRIARRPSAMSSLPSVAPKNNKLSSQTCRPISALQAAYDRQRKSAFSATSPVNTQSTPSGPACSGGCSLPAPNIQGIPSIPPPRPDTSLALREPTPMPSFAPTPPELTPSFSFTPPTAPSSPSFGFAAPAHRPSVSGAVSTLAPPTVSTHAGNTSSDSSKPLSSSPSQSILSQMDPTGESCYCPQSQVSSGGHDKQQWDLQIPASSASPSAQSLPTPPTSPPTTSSVKRAPAACASSSNFGCCGRVDLNNVVLEELSPKPAYCGPSAADCRSSAPRAPQNVMDMVCHDPRAVAGCDLMPEQTTSASERRASNGCNKCDSVMTLNPSSMSAATSFYIPDTVYKEVCIKTPVQVAIIDKKLFCEHEQERLREEAEEDRRRRMMRDSGRRDSWRSCGSAAGEGKKAELFDYTTYGDVHNFEDCKQHKALYRTLSKMNICNKCEEVREASAADLQCKYLEVPQDKMLVGFAMPKELTPVSVCEPKVEEAAAAQAALPTSSGKCASECNCLTRKPRTYEEIKADCDRWIKEQEEEAKKRAAVESVKEQPAEIQSCCARRESAAAAAAAAAASSAQLAHMERAKTPGGTTPTSTVPRKPSATPGLGTEDADGKGRNFLSVIKDFTNAIGNIGAEKTETTMVPEVIITPPTPAANTTVPNQPTQSSFPEVPK